LTDSPPRSLQADVTAESSLPQAVAAAKVLQVVSADKGDDWYRTNAPILQKLVRKGMISDDTSLHEALHPVFDRMIQLYPLPKEGEDGQPEMSEFHTFVQSSISDSLLNGNSLRGILLMLKSVIQVVPDRVGPFGEHLIKLLTKLAKEHTQAPSGANMAETHVRLMTAVLDICQPAVSFLGQENRHKLMLALGHLMGQSKSVPLCRYILDMVRSWTLDHRDPYPTMKEKAMLLQKMVLFESKPEVFDAFLELIYDVYTAPSLRRSELTTRLETCFLLGCRARDASLRERFIDLLDVSIQRTLSSRLTYILGVQSWEPLADHNWIYLALHLLLGTIEGDHAVGPGSAVSFGMSPTGSFPGTIPTSAIIRSLQRLLFVDPQVAHDVWVSFFSSAWSGLSKREQADITHHMITLLSKEYHIKQAELRPNVIQSLLTSIHKCSPTMLLPPHLIKYLAKTFGAWHVGAEILEGYMDVSEDASPDSMTVFESLAEVYAELAESDVFYGLWRRGSFYSDTNMAVALEQNGMWEQASMMYETAQSKARSGVIPFMDHEYSLWEDHWMLAAEKLQHWDILYDLARGENNYELMLESAWRIKDWSDNVDSLEEQIRMLPEVATPRRRVFEAFLALLKSPGLLDKNVEFTKSLEDAMQLSLRKWTSLPPQLSAAHVPLLQHFQQFVELQEAVQIFGSLSTTTAQNLEKKSSDLKMVLQAWRERLPNLCDDISVLSDLVAWRQNVFNAINKTYLPLIQTASQGAAGVNANTYGYRGFHETAWIINRFAHVSRKHDLLDVCSSSLNRIYTLPNIEISEAFLKLREQARCHYQRPNDLQAGLDVINNTNLMYFSNSQKAEFYTLKGMFHAKFGRSEEANDAFNQAIQLDISQAKAWAAWGKWNDAMFKEEPTEIKHASTAVMCYLHAAGTYKSSKSRPLLTRILWLLSVEDPTFSISRAFDTYKGEAAFWYWIALIPQLCLSISHREVKQARYILLNLAKLYPQVRVPWCLRGTLTDNFPGFVLPSSHHKGGHDVPETCRRLASYEYQPEPSGSPSADQQRFPNASGW
jgi:transformation/transcription domain-associated protein